MLVRKFLVSSHSSGRSRTQAIVDPLAVECSYYYYYHSIIIIIILTQAIVDPLVVECDDGGEAERWRRAVVQLAETVARRENKRALRVPGLRLTRTLD